MEDIRFNKVPQWCFYTPLEIKKQFEFDLQTATGIVEYRCVHCRFTKQENINTIRFRIRKGTFTSLCHKCRGILQRKKEELLIVKKIPTWLNKYFNSSSKTVLATLNVKLAQGELSDIKLGKSITRGLKTDCLNCYSNMHSSISRIKRSIEAGSYTGLCLKCLSSIRNNVSLDNPKITGSGYILIQKSLVPSQHHLLCDWSVPVMMHRYKMAVKLNRVLTKDEIVHHIDGNKQNNSIDNLELWNKSHPSGQRVIDKLRWAKEFILKYEKEMLQWRSV